MSRRDDALSGVGRGRFRAASGRPLDETDLALLRLLAADARTSQRQLAAKLGISPPTVGERMNRLERSGVTRGYPVQVDWEALGFGMPVYLSITAAAGYDVATIMRSLWNIPEIEDVTLVTGRLDLIARLRVRNDSHLRSVLLNQIWLISGMQGTEAMLGMAAMQPKDMLTNLITQMQDESARAPAQDARPVPCQNLSHGA
ncbi:MAG: Lrp/AsnC family transcriptional regulator, leucine-responsive regulatory protein [Micromonosporaceae bacterium]|jgi:DNA-binding Lrp family transcriptional regulator|nr:Lrp/AsnC family transcriptional regulator, leucine-responsive regulatory protein [Micromonosporaceae bacterium]